MASNETIKQAVIAGMGLNFDVNVVRQQSNVLAPSAEAFRYFMIEHGEAYMLAHDSTTTRRCSAAPNQRWRRRPR